MCPISKTRTVFNGWLIDHNERTKADIKRLTWKLWSPSLRWKWRAEVPGPWLGWQRSQSWSPWINQWQVQWIPQWMPQVLVGLGYWMGPRWPGHKQSGQLFQSALKELAEKETVSGQHVHLLKTKKNSQLNSKTRGPQYLNFAINTFCNWVEYFWLQ